MSRHDLDIYLNSDGTVVYVSLTGERLFIRDISRKNTVWHGNSFSKDQGMQSENIPRWWITG